MLLKYNTPIEVNQKQYNVCMSKHHGICAGRTDNGKYFIKIMFMKYAQEVIIDLKKHE